MTGTLLGRMAILAALPLLFIHRLPPMIVILTIAAAGIVLLWANRT